MKLIKMILISFILFLFTGCGIKDELKNDARHINEKIDTISKNIDREKENLYKSELGIKYKDYVKEENLISYLNESNDMFVNLSKEQKNLQALINKDSKNDNETVEAKIKEINDLIVVITKKYLYPSQRLKELDLFEKELEKNKITLDNIIPTYLEENNILIELLEKNKKEFILKESVLNEKITQLNLLKEKITVEYNSFLEMYNGKKNLSKLSNLNQEITISLKTFQSLKIKNEKEMKELKNSYTKILIDMTEKHYVIVGRVSWDEDSDYETENNYSFEKVLIPNDTYSYYSSLENNIAEFSKGILGGLKLNISPDSWDTLKVKFPTENMNYSDTNAEFYIEDIVSEYFHKYIIIDNDKITETEFINVSEDEYEDNIENLGMSLITKPYGNFDDEKITTATPAGLEFVGNQHYGEWKTNNNGISFFEFYGMYSMLNNFVSPNNYNNNYSRIDYEAYKNRDKKEHYYAGGIYGSSGTFINSDPRYHNTMYNKTVKEHKGSIHNSNTVRASGTQARGRGPGGGGK